MNLFQKHLLVCGYLVVIILAYIAYIAYTAHPMYDKIDISTLKEYKVPPRDTNNVLSVYISGELGIAHIHFSNNSIYFENGGDPIEFSSREDMYDYISEMTAYSSTIMGYQYDLNHSIHKGYIFCRTVYNEDEQYTDIVYQGPNWTVDATKDTTYIISTFNNVEKLYDAKNKTTWYEHYTVKDYKDEIPDNT